MHIPKSQEPNDANERKCFNEDSCQIEYYLLIPYLKSNSLHKAKKVSLLY